MMRFTLPSLIATLLLAGLAGCGNARRDASSDLAQKESAENVAQKSAEGPIAVGHVAVDQFAEGDPATAELTEPLAAANSGIIALNPFPADELDTTPVGTQQANEQASSPPQRSSQSSQIRAYNCMVQYINKINIPAKAEGTLMELKFEEGDTVTEGDVLAIIDNTAAKLALELKKAEEKEAELNGENEVNLKDAVNSEKLASAESEAYKELHRERAIPFWEMEKKRLEAVRAGLRIELAQMQKKIAEVQYFAKRSEREIAEFELTRREVTAPATGFVEARIAQLGEWVQPGSPLATLIQMDRLRVEGDIDVEYDGQIKRGTPVQVTINPDSNNPIKLNGKLGFVSMEIDLNHKLRVWVEIENKKVGNDWTIKPGMLAEIVIEKPAQIF